MIPTGTGGFAMGTVAGLNTRRYHGLLVASDPTTLNRTSLLVAVEAHAEFNGNVYALSSNQYSGAIHPDGHKWLERFETDGALVKWTYLVDGVRLEKSVVAAIDSDSIRIRWKNLSDRPTRIVLRPLTACRSYHGNQQESSSYPGEVGFDVDRTEVRGIETLVLQHDGAYRTPIGGWYYRFENKREIERGLDPRDDLYCPCELAFVLMPSESCDLIASDSEASSPQTWIESMAEGEPLDLASKRFVIGSKTSRSIIAGYPWFTDWGRDTMISLPGICLVQGDFESAKGILRGYASQISKGMIPNRIVESGDLEYNSADATLWFIDAVYQTLKNWDPEFAREMLQAIDDIHAWHVKGTRFGIRVDPRDGLLTQGEPGKQLTWMDAKIGDWVVTPRRGKAIEISALWIHAMRSASWIAERLGVSSEKYRTSAEKAEANFEKKFWRKSLGYYLDVADPDDASLRPNQVLAMSLEFSHCQSDHAKMALERVAAELATPYGLRTLAPSDLAYRGRFEGPLSELDSAYHQGTVWPWLTGSYVAALIKFGCDQEWIDRALANSGAMLENYGLGGIAEVYDGDAPQRPGGCPWQAWSVAEIRRANMLVKAYESGQGE